MTPDGYIATNQFEFIWDFVGMLIETYPVRFHLSWALGTFVSGYMVFWGTRFPFFALYLAAWFFFPFGMQLVALGTAALVYLFVAVAAVLWAIESIWGLVTR